MATAIADHVVSASAPPLRDRGAGYVEPILVQPLCLACHGEALAPPAGALRVGWSTRGAA